MTSIPQVSRSVQQSQRQSGLILVVDDDEATTELVATIIAYRGYESQIAFDGRSALQLARARWPNLVITDQVMPFVNGAELIAALRVEAVATHRTQVPVILMTAAHLQDTNKPAADAILLKPFALHELEQLMQGLLSTGFSA